MPYTPHRLPTYSLADLTLTHLELVESIKAYEGENGVVFAPMPRGRCQHPGTRRIYNIRSFRPLAGLGLLDVGSGYDDPVRTTQAGLDWVFQRRGIR